MVVPQEKRGRRREDEGHIWTYVGLTTLKHLYSSSHKATMLSELPVQVEVKNAPLARMYLNFIICMPTKSNGIKACWSQVEGGGLGQCSQHNHFLHPSPPSPIVRRDLRSSCH